MRLAIVVPRATWGWALQGRTELRLATDERDAALATLVRQNNEIAALRSHVASFQGRTGVLTVKLEAAEAWKIERHSRPGAWKLGGLTFALGVVAGAVASEAR